MINENDNKRKKNPDLGPGFGKIRPNTAGSSGP